MGGSLLQSEITKKLILRGICVVLVCIGCLAILAYFISSYKTELGGIIETYSKTGKTFVVRVTCHEETGVIMGASGAFYKYEAKNIGDESWNHIVTFRHDDPIPIPKHQILVHSDQVAYFYMGWIFGVTTDGAKTWSVWNAEHDLPGWKPANYRLIKDVGLTQEGKGIMVLKPIRYKYTRLESNDFGKTWYIPDAVKPQRHYRQSS